jgi:hypothetical protein
MIGGPGCDTFEGRWGESSPEKERVMAKMMIHDMEEDVVRRRIAKARDPRSNPKFRLAQALELVELLARILDSRSQDEEQPAPEDQGDTPEPEKVQGESEPSTQEELEPITDAPEVVGEDGGYKE